MEAAFLQFLNKFGVDVTITHRTQKIDEDGDPVLNERDKPEFDELEVPVTARINIQQGQEKIIENLILKVGDAVGKFKISDQQYLNEDSFITYQKNGINFKFKIKDIIPKEVYILALLKRVEV